MFTDLLGMSWDVLTWVVTYVWLFCVIVFTMVMAKTLIDLARKVLKNASPGWKKFFQKAGLTRR